jgi:hypothetical protein
MEKEEHNNFLYFGGRINEIHLHHCVHKTTNKQSIKYPLNRQTHTHTHLR